MTKEVAPSCLLASKRSQRFPTILCDFIPYVIFLDMHAEYLKVEKLLEERLRKLDFERQSILARRQEIKAGEKNVAVTNVPFRGQVAASKTPTSPQEKINLFLDLFRCRESVCPRLWENPRKNLKSCYSNAARVRFPSFAPIFKYRAPQALHKANAVT